MFRGILHNPTLLNMAKDKRGILLDMWIFSKVSNNLSIKLDFFHVLTMSTLQQPTVTCNMNFTLFPFDVQSCLLELQVPLVKNVPKILLKAECDDRKLRRPSLEIVWCWQQRPGWRSPTLSRTSRTRTLTTRSVSSVFLQRWHVISNFDDMQGAERYVWQAND